MTARRGLVLHVQEGNNDLYGWFCNKAAKGSYTFWVSKAGQVIQYVDDGISAWGQGAGNLTWNSVGTEGYAREPLTVAQEQGLAKIYAEGNRRYGWPWQIADSPNGVGFAWHGMGGSAWGNHPGCPGDLRKHRRLAILALAQGKPAVAPKLAPGPAEQPVPAAPKPAAKPVAAGAPAWPGRYLRKGVVGADVRQYQTRAKERGWNIVVDGHFGPKMDAMTRAYQREKGLDDDGVVGRLTWDSIFRRDNVT